MALTQDPYSHRGYIDHVHTLFMNVEFHTYVYCYIHAVGLSVDWINNKIYYVDGHYSRGSDYIGVLDFINGQFKKLITTSVGNLQDIVVDPTTR